MRKLARIMGLVGMLCAAAGSVLAQGGEDFLPADLEPITAANVDRLEVLGRLGLGYVDDLYWSPDGSLLVLGGDNHFWTYDMTAPTERPKWHAGHLDPQAEGVVCTPDEVSAIETCRDVLTGEPLWMWPEVDAGSVEFQWIHPSRAYAVRDVKLAEPETGYRLEVYAIASGERVHTYLHLDNWGIWSRAVPTLIPPDTLFYKQSEAVVRVDLASGAVRALGLPVVRDTRISFSPDGALIVVHNWAEERADGPWRGVVVWDVAADAPRFTLTLDEPNGDPVFSPDQSRLALGTWQGIFIFDARTGAQVNFLPILTGEIRDMAFDSAGERLLSFHPFLMDERVLLWDVASGTQVDNLTRSLGAGHLVNVDELAINATGTMLASAAWQGLWDSDAILWDLTTGERLRVWRASGVSIGFRLDGNLIVEGALIQVGDTPVSPDAGAYGDVVSGDGRYVTRSNDPMEPHAEIVQVWAVDSGQVVAQLPIPPEQQQALALNHDGSRLFAMSTVSVQVWDVATQTILAESRMGSARAELLNISPAPPAIGPNYLLVQWRETGMGTYYVGLLDPDYHMYPRLYAAGQDVDASAFNPQADVVVTSSSERVQFWSFDHENLLYMLPGHQWATFSGDGRVMATVRDGVIWLWGVHAEH